VVASRLEDWRRLLRSSPTQARTVLQRVLRGRLVFKPTENGNGYDFEGETRFDRLFAGIATPKPAFLDRYERPARDRAHRGRGHP